MAAIEAFKEADWYRKFLSVLENFPGIDTPVTFYCVNMVDILNTKDSRHYMRRSTLMGSIK